MSTTIRPDDVVSVLESLSESSPVRAVIDESWGRCRSAGIDPHKTPLRRVSADELTSRLEANADLIAAARQQLDWMSAILVRTRHVVYVTDADGIVLASTGTDADLVREAGLEPGYDWSERRMGTNGAGTALVTGRPEAVIGGEHYCQAFRDCTCTAAPIIDAEGGVVGAFDITTATSEGVAERLMLAMHAALVIGRDLNSIRAARQAEILKRAAFELLGKAGDPENAVSRLLHLLVEQLADWAVLYPIQPITNLRLAVAHKDPAMQAPLWDLWSGEHTPVGLPGHPAAEAIRTGCSVLWPRGSRDHFGDRSGQKKLSQLLRTVEPHSYLCVPLEVEKRVAGVLILGSASSYRPFRGQDVALAEELMRFVGLALHNASVRAEREQADAQIRFQSSLLDAVEQAVIATDLEGRIVYWGPFAEKLYGWNALEVMGRPITDVTPAPELRASSLAILDQLRAGKSWSGRLRVQRKDGSEFLAQVTDSAIYDSNENIIGIVGVSHDCSQAQRLEEAQESARAEAERRAADAENAERMLRALLDHVPEGITIATAPDIQIVAVSRYGEALVGRPHVELAIAAGDPGHASTWGILRPDGSAASDDELPLTRAVRDGEVSTDEEWLLERPDGSRVTILTNASPIRDGDGRIVGGVIAWRDISERKRVEQQLRENETRLRELYQAAEDAVRTRDEVLGVVSHDLRNPLNAVFMASCLLAEPDLPEDKKEVQQKVIRRAVQKMIRLIDDLLDVTRIETGSLRIVTAPVEPRVLVSDAANQIEPLLREQGITPVVRVAKDLPLVLVDQGRVGQVFDNLLSNALRYSPAGSSITISAELDGDYVRFAVADAGPGVPEAERPHLFERFWQGKRGNSGRAGLGLSICRGIVAAHGGRIWLDDAAAKGTTICFTVPVAAHRAVTESTPVRA